MVRSDSRKRACALSLVMLVVVLSGFSVARPAGAADDSLQMIPADSLFCVRINNLDGALAQMDQFLTGIYPASVSMLVKAQLGHLLGSPDIKGIDLAGCISVFGPLPGGANAAPTRIGILIPVSNYQEFVSGNPNVSEPNTAGISLLGPEGSPVLAVMQLKGFALATPTGNARTLPEADKMLAANTTGLGASLDAAERQQATAAPFWAYGNLQLAGKMFGPMVKAKLEQAKSMFQAMAAQGQPQMASAQASMDMYAGMFDALITEGKYASFAFTPSPDKLGAGFRLAALPDTGMANLFTNGQTTSDNGLLGYMRNDAAMDFASSSNRVWIKLNNAYLKMLPKLLGEKMSPDQLQQIKTLMTNATEALSGPVAGSMMIAPGNKPPFALTYVAQIKDAAKFYEVLDEASRMMDNGPLADFYRSLGMKMSFDLTRNAAAYKGLPIDTIHVVFESTDPNAPQAQVIKSVYGIGINIQMAIVDHLLVYAFAQDPTALVHTLIDEVQAGGTEQPPSDVQSALRLIPGAAQADFFMTFNVLRLIRMATAIVPVPLPLPQVEVQSQSAIAMTANTGSGKLAVDLAVPKQQVMDVMTFVMQAQQQMQQQKMQQNQSSDANDQM